MLTTLWLALLPIAVVVEVVSVLALNHYRFRPQTGPNAAAGTTQRDGAGTYRLPVRPLGLRAGVDLTHALQLADQLEDEEPIREHR